MFASLASKRNLMLSWRRITTSSDARYKKFFRPIYESYELAAESSIRDLHLRLLSGEYSPSEPIRLYYPKASGLQRPITLLSLEDQIVFQSLANIFAGKIREKRKPLLGSAVFSNWENDSESIFFLKDWKKSFGSLRRYLLQKHKDGYSWVASFDLSAFYDTIDHGLLLKAIAPRAVEQRIVNESLRWLKVWSSDKKTSQYGHGIPQGPIASSYLAEAFMLPIDLHMSDSFVYARYVDDIRILGRTSTEVRKALVVLDRLCRERGLIPNAGKFTIREIKSERDLVADIPDLFAYFVDERDSNQSQNDIERIIEESIYNDEAKGGYQIIEKSKLRYALFRSAKSEKVLRIVLNLLPDFPEHVDAYSAFFENYETSDEIISVVIDLLKQEYPYDYVRGELWKIVARMGTNNQKTQLKDIAIRTVQDHNSGMAVKIGSYAFLCSCDRQGLGAYTRWVNYAHPLAQALVAPYLDIQSTTSSETVKIFLSRTLPDVGLSLIDNFVNARMRIVDFGLSAENLPLASANSFHVAGLIANLPPRPVDPIGAILAKRYSIHKWSKWRDLFRTEYKHAYQILVLADLCYKSHRSEWLGNQDSFNDVLFRSLLSILIEKKVIAPVALSDTRGLLDYGKLLYDTSEFRKKFPNLSNQLINAHNRRRTVPSSHPYDKKTGIKSTPLGKREQGELLDKLSKAYAEIINIANSST